MNFTTRKPNNRVNVFSFAVNFVGLLVCSTMQLAARISPRCLAALSSAPRSVSRVSSVSLIPCNAASDSDTIANLQTVKLHGIPHGGPVSLYCGWHWRKTLSTRGGRRTSTMAALNAASLCGIETRSARQGLHGQFWAFLKILRFERLSILRIWYHTFVLKCLLLWFQSYKHKVGRQICVSVELITRSFFMHTAHLFCSHEPVRQYITCWQHVP